MPDEPSQQKLIGELPAAPNASAEIAAIAANLPVGLDLEQFRNRAIAGDTMLGNVVSALIASSVGDIAVAEAVQAKLMEKVAKLTDIRDITLAAEAVKNLSAAKSASSEMLLKCAGIKAYGKQKQNRQVNAPQTINVNGNAQIAVGAVPSVNRT